MTLELVVHVPYDTIFVIFDDRKNEDRKRIIVCIALVNGGADDLAIISKRYAFCAICDGLVQIIVVGLNYGVSCALVDQLPKLFCSGRRHGQEAI